MSVARLRFQRYSATRDLSGPYIYGGDLASFHDWEFRTHMRLKLYEDAVRAKTRKGSANGSDTKSESGDDPASASEQEASAPAAAAESADEPRTPSEARVTGLSDAAKALDPRPVLRRACCCLRPWLWLRKRHRLSSFALTWCIGCSKDFVMKFLSWPGVSNPQRSQEA